MFGVKTLFRSPTTLSFVDFFLLGWFYSLLAALLGRYPMTLASLTSWVLQGNPGFNFTASHNGLSTGPPFRDTPDTWLTLVAFFGHGGKFHNPLFLPLTLKPEPHGQSCYVLLLTGARTWTPHSITSPPVFCHALPKRGCPETCSVDQADLNLRELSTSAFPELGCPPHLALSFSLVLLHKLET